MNVLTDEEILAAMTPEAVEGDWYLPQTFARAIESAVLAKLAALDVEPVAWWVPKAEQFAIMDKPKTRPFAKAFEPLFTKAQLLAVQQRAAEACAKVCGEMISPSKPLSDNPYQAWMPLPKAPEDLK